MRYASRIDNNQNAIVKELRYLSGVSVTIVSQLKAFCDIVVGYQGKTYLIELKNTPKDKLTPKEEEFRAGWFGHYAICYSTEDVLKEIGY